MSAPDEPVEVLVVVQARAGSTRLPGKVLQPLGRTTVLGLLLQRLAGATQVDRVVVATSDRPGDDAVATEARAHGIAVVRGPEDDVLARFLLALEAHPARVVVRITADCPLVDPAWVDAVVAPVLADDADVAANDGAGWIRGFDVEAMTADALRAAGRTATDPAHRVHVTPWLYERGAGLRVVRLAWPEDRSHLRLTVDEPADLEVVRAVVERLPDPVRAGWREIVAVLDADPTLAAANADVRQKAVDEG